MRNYGAHWLKTSVVEQMKLMACGPVWKGTGSLADRATIDDCTARHCISGTVLIFTREEGYHSGGWWKNPDYERCFHLSLSFCDPETGVRAPFNSKLADDWIDLFFGDNKRLLWVEPPYSPEGKHAAVFHYRLFCNPAWQPMKPRGEVYNTHFTEAGWKSWSDLHAPAGGAA